MGFGSGRWQYNPDLSTRRGFLSQVAFSGTDNVQLKDWWEHFVSLRYKPGLCWKGRRQGLGNQSKLRIIGGQFWWSPDEDMLTWCVLRTATSKDVWRWVFVAMMVRSSWDKLSGRNLKNRGSESGTLFFVFWIRALLTGYISIYICLLISRFLGL